MFRMELTVTDIATKKIYAKHVESDTIEDIKNPVMDEIKEMCKENNLNGHIIVNYLITDENEYYDSEETVFFVTKDYNLAE